MPGWSAPLLHASHTIRLACDSAHICSICNGALIDHFSQLSDLSRLRDPVDMDPEHLESLATEAFERRIANLERENKEYQRRTQGKKH